MNGLPYPHLEPGQLWPAVTPEERATMERDQRRAEGQALRGRIFDKVAEAVMVLIWTAFLLGAVLLLTWNSALWFVGDLPDWYTLLLVGALARGAISFAADIVKRRFRL